MSRFSTQDGHCSVFVAHVIFKEQNSCIKRLKLWGRQIKPLFGVLLYAYETKLVLNSTELVSISAATIPGQKMKVPVTWDSWSQIETSAVVKLSHQRTCVLMFQNSFSTRLMAIAQDKRQKYGTKNHSDTKLIETGKKIPLWFQILHFTFTFCKKTHQKLSSKTMVCTGLSQPNDSTCARNNYFAMGRWWNKTRGIREENNCQEHSRKHGTDDERRASPRPGNIRILLPAFPGGNREHNSPSKWLSTTNATKNGKWRKRMLWESPKNA